MRKNGTRMIGLLLAVLMLFQMPVSALAEEVFPYEEEILLDDASVSGEEEITDPEEISDPGEISDSKEPAEDDAGLIIESIETEELTEETETAELSVHSANAEPEEAQEIHVTVSVSKDGKFLDDKDGNPMAGREITLSNQASYTMDDALKVAHDLYYPGGSEAGYDYHADEEGIFSGVIYKLWGWNRDDVPFIRFSLNRDSSLYGAALSQKISDGDEMHFYIQQRSGVDLLAFFTRADQTIRQGESVTLHLKQRSNSGSSASDCVGASIYIDGVKKEGLTTDEQGCVTVEGLEPRETPYFITAEKLEQDSSGNMVTLITAAYTNINVIASEAQKRDYLEKVTLHMAVDEKEKDISLTCLDGSQPFLIPAEMAYRAFTTKAEMYVLAETLEALPDNCQIYAVYADPVDEAEHRIKLDKNTWTYLRFAIARGATGEGMITRNKAIQSIRLEVWQDKAIVESKTLPIVYCNHLASLEVINAKEEKIPVELKDTLDDQIIELEVPENEKYINIWARPYGYVDTKTEFTVNNETQTLLYHGTYKLDLDWTQGRENYVLTIKIIGSGKDDIARTASYTLVIKKGKIDYTPDVKIETTGSEGMIVKGSASPVITATATVLRPEEGELHYQWYYAGRTEYNFSPGNISLEKYMEIDGAVNASYSVPTDQIGNAKSYRCKVTYTIDNETYSRWSEPTSYTIVSPEVETPEIKKQPQNIQYVKGKPMTDGFVLEIEETPWLDLEAQYQWYKNKDNSVVGGEQIEDATDAVYSPEIPDQENTYYYCKVRYQRSGWNSETGYVVSCSEEICSDVVSVTMLSEALPWEGTGSEKDPYQLRNLTDLESLCEKVNKEGYAFDGMHFLMTADISLDTDWKPIGTIEPGKTETGKGMYLWAFSGIFNGGGHTLTMADGGKPLFNYVRNAVVEDLKLAGKNINGYGLIDRYTVDYGVDGDYDTGCPDAVTIRNVTLKSGMSTKKAGLIGGYASGANDVVIENCTAEQGVVIGYTGQEGSIGTFAGTINGIIRNCHSAATVYGSSKVGGLAGAKGQSMGACTIENSSFTGSVVASGSWVGGILGSGYEANDAPNTPVASVKNCYVAGSVSGASNIGGIFGGEPSCKQCWGNGSGAIANNFFYGTVSGSSNVGAIVGYLRSFDKFQGITNNYYLDTCGAADGIGGIGTILTTAGVHQDLPYEVDAAYGIDYTFDQKRYCFPKTAAEFADGTVTGGLNSGNYNNWEQGSSYPVYGQGPMPSDFP